MAAATEHFAKSLAEVELGLSKAVTLSEAAIGKLYGWRGIWGSILHARIITNAGTMLKVIEAATEAPDGAQLLDHFSVASIARTAMEASVMMLYITDPNISDDVFEMRRTVFQLQDTCHRSRMFKDAGTSSPNVEQMRDMYREKIGELRAELEAMPAFKNLNEEQRKRTLEGRDYYIGGVRAAVRSVGIDLGEYETWESYLSGYIHSMPMSFIRADMHGIDFSSISAFQYDLCGTALFIAAKALERSTQRMSGMLGASTAS